MSADERHQRNAAVLRVPSLQPLWSPHVLAWRQAASYLQQTDISPGLFHAQVNDYSSPHFSDHSFNFLTDLDKPGVDVIYDSGASGHVLNNPSLFDSPPETIWGPLLNGISGTV